jgi:ketosteroid isomerase-like protein
MAEGQDDVRLIKEARARSNAAIAVHDADALARVWMTDVTVVTSTGATTSGREANRASFAAQFTSRPDVVYVRTPAEIEVMPSWDVASERGTWTGQWTQADGVTKIGGKYQAQWRKVDGAWLLQAELFVPTHCEGSSWCSRHP